MAFAQEASPFELLVEHRFQSVERDVEELKAHVPAIAVAGALAFLFGAFCAIWAQNSDRNTFFWFVLGSLFSVFTVMWVLKLNADDLRARRERVRLRRHAKNREAMSRPSAPYPAEQIRSEA